uniref:SMB domain-containing protein n=1 Tax=Onchocerca flexuosa TaxID=387005 RepID=A0A183HMM7_9BILA
LIIQFFIHEKNVFVAERIRDAIIIGRSVGVFRGWKIACIIDEDSIGDGSEVNFSTEGIEFKGDVHNLLFSMEREFCELHLKFNDSKQTNVSFNSDNRMKKHALSYQQAAKATEEIKISDTNKLSQMTDQSALSFSSNTDNYETKEMNYHQKLIQQYINATSSLQCLNISNWDARANDILRFNCAQLLPLDAQCPFSSSRTPENQYIMCCCGHRSFCNYNVCLTF